MTSYDNVSEDDLKKFRKFGFSEVKTKSKTEAARYAGNANIILYKTGKLLVQGSKENVEEAAKIAKFIGIGTTKENQSGLSIGTDESLKGDTFGGIVVAGFLADPDIRKNLNDMGVRDSKTLHNPDIVRIATELMAKYPNSYHVESILPKEYNKLNARQNVTEILDLLHEKCYKKIAGRKTGIIHIVDLYPNCGVGDVKEHHAESKFPEVAAASVMARYAALMQIQQLSKTAGFFIPLGSTHVESALLELKKKSLKPEEYVKMKFQNVVKFFS